MCEELLEDVPAGAPGASAGVLLTSSSVPHSVSWRTYTSVLLVVVEGGEVRRVRLERDELAVGRDRRIPAVAVSLDRDVEGGQDACSEHRAVAYPAHVDVRRVVRVALHEVGGVGLERDVGSVVAERRIAAAVVRAGRTRSRQPADAEELALRAVHEHVVVLVRVGPLDVLGVERDAAAVVRDVREEAAGVELRSVVLADERRRVLLQVADEDVGDAVRVALDEQLRRRLERDVAPVCR